ncbi:hypothetical protein LSUB1_G004218 [Lachnellula subtilissima]|uniref:Integral membrane protein n=1 Tax=Lachnellula subtilissima TaxID=602034 RepID=A0A8H8RL82_9HELO|nr:hypothetical protein LSUB1_G004218 [Lachnellula subtilissima]
MDPDQSVPSSQPPPPSSTTQNPVIAIGRKVKSALSTQQQPSIRILRASSSTGESRPSPSSSGVAEKPLPELPQSNENASTNRFLNAANRASAAVRSVFDRGENVTDDGFDNNEYDTDTVDLMDVVDPEVSTLSTLTNVQNSLFIPSLGKIINRRATYKVSEEPSEVRLIDKLKASLKRLKLAVKEDKRDTSPLSNAQYAVLPDGQTLQGWTQENKEELDDIVRHMLHSRRARFKRSMRGFWQYIHRPLGLFVTVYATLITLFGAAWVLFLIGWISIGSKRSYVINIVDNVLVALFAIIGDGLAPFRAVDTYHMIYIAHYHRKTWKRRDQLGLPELVDHNDLPEQREEEAEPAEVDLESLVARKMPRGLARRIAPRIPNKLAQRMIARNDSPHPSHEYSVLSEEELAKLEYHERKFSKSHTFYKPHETETHFAFPLKLLIAVVVLLDCHSALQITLGACTWGISYHTRPFALTTVVLCCSITCNIMGGVLISIGDKRTRKKDVIERMMREELTLEAIEQMETRWMKEAEERGEVDPAVRKKLKEEKEEAESEEIKNSWKVVPSLPKTLLGKGVDHRQPSLPQKDRSSSSVDSTTAKSSTTRKPLPKGSTGLPSLQEDPAQVSRPKPTARSGEEPAEGMGPKVTRFIRRADMDKS